MKLLLSTAYAPPIAYMALLYRAQGGEIVLEGCEHYLKQSYRNRCDILTARGVQSLTIPVERPHGSKTLIRDVRVSEHGRWRALHPYALATAYGASPYFEYYWDDFAPLYEAAQGRSLWDFNLDLLQCLCSLMGLEVCLRQSSDFVPPSTTPVEGDHRYTFHPRVAEVQRAITPRYYQPFEDRLGFVGGLSAFDLLFNMGPESLLVLRDMSASIFDDLGIVGV